MRVFLYFTLFIFTLPQLSFSQNDRAYFKFIPPNMDNAPDWAVLMYDPDPNVFQVDFLYTTYYDTHAFEKNIHTQNYKHWRREIRDMVSFEGKIIKRSPEEDKVLFSTLRTKRSGSQQKSTSTWTSIGPFQTFKSGTSTPVSWHANVYSIDISRNNTSLLICGTESGGVFKSTDKGLNWSLVSKDETFSNGITAVKIDPNDDMTFLISGNSRIYRSTDGGATWAEILYTGGRANEIVYDPDDGQHIFISGDFGLYESTNGGSSWGQVYTDDCWDIVFHPTNHDTVYLLKSNPGLIKTEFLRSTNSGANWTTMTSGWYVPQDINNASNAGGKIGISPASPDRVYACLIGDSKANDNGWIGIYRSDNSGSTWYLPSGQIGSPYNAVNVMPWNAAAYTSGYHQGYYNFDLEVSETNADLLWFGTIRLSESSDGGYTYTSIGAADSDRLFDIHADIQDIEVVGSDIWVASDGGINLSTDNLQSHTARNYALIGSNFWGFGAGWNEDVLVGGKYHNGNTAYYQAYGTGQSHNVGGVEEATGYVHPLTPRNGIFNQYWSGVSVSKQFPSTLGGPLTNLPSLNLIPNESYVESSSSGFYFDPHYADHIYAGKSSVIFKSVDGGISFDTLHDFQNNGKVFEIAISRADPDVIYCVFQPGGGYWDWCEIHRTTDGGMTWTQLTNVPSNNRWRLNFSLSHTDPNEIWVTSVNGANGQKVYQSTNGGASWINRTTSILDDEKAKDILYQGGSKHIVYLATNFGVYYWSNTLNDWTNCSTGLPLVTNALKFKPFYRDSKLRLATYGRGIWEMDLVEDFDVQAQAMTYADTVRCSRDTVRLDSYSVVGHSGTSWLWSVTPAPQYIESTTMRNPRVVLGSNGSYDVSLTVTDASGSSDTYTATSFIIMDSRCDPDTVAGKHLETYASGDFVQLPNFDLRTNRLTITAWIYPDTIQDNYASIVMNDENAAGLNFREGNNTLGYHWPGGAWWWDSNLEVPANTWSYVALVAEPTGVTLYLNGVGVKHTTSIDSVDLETMKIGSYKGWASRNFRGKIEEVCIFKKSLTEAEIRYWRHLTKDKATPVDQLLAYYQFNDSGPEILDRSGYYHGSLSGGAALHTSMVPVGGGEANGMHIAAAGSYSFGNTGCAIEFSNGTLPNEDVYVSLIRQLPHIHPASLEGLRSYWIINNYGPDSITAAQNMSFDDPLSSVSSEAISDPMSVDIYNRNTHATADPWTKACHADQVNFPTTDDYFFSSACTISSFGQFFIGRSCAYDVNVTDDLTGMQTIKAGHNITATNKILSTADIIYQAQMAVILDPGFEVFLGAVFEALIGPCGQ